MDRKAIVYLSLEGETYLTGTLWARSKNGKESATFQYDPTWIARGDRFALEPAIRLDKAPHHTPAGKSLFGSMGDSAPDRWGRTLLKRRERMVAASEARAARTLSEFDYLIMVDDITRQGAIRFKVNPGEEFLAHDKSRIPHLIKLPILLRATAHVQDETETAAELKLLLLPGSSLGGARPKASVLDKDGTLLMAKFPKKDDEWDVELWSHIANKIAALAGVNVSASRIVRIQGSTVLLSRRFDRANNARIPFLSAMSMIGASDGEEHSYLELADAIRSYGIQPNLDLEELWRRILLHILISNIDDHMRNHGFLYDTRKSGWCLSPAYDLNPVPVAGERMLSLMIDDKDRSASFELLLAIADYFGITSEKAKAIVSVTVNAVRLWEKIAYDDGATRQDILKMEKAFEHREIKEAEKFVSTVMRK